MERFTYTEDKKLHDVHKRVKHINSRILRNLSEINVINEKQINKINERIQNGKKVINRNFVLLRYFGCLHSNLASYQQIENCT